MNSCVKYQQMLVQQMVSQSQAAQQKLDRASAQAKTAAQRLHLAHAASWLLEANASLCQAMSILHRYEKLPSVNGRRS